MGARVRATRSLDGHVRIDLGRRQSTVAEQLLDGAQIGAGIEKMGREGMTQHVRARVGRLRRVSQRGLDTALHGSARQTPAPPSREERYASVLAGWRRGARAQVRVQDAAHRPGERQDALTIALAAHPHRLGFRLHVVAIQLDELGQSHAGSVEHFEQGAIATAARGPCIGRVESGENAFEIHRARQPARATRCANSQGRVVFAKTECDLMAEESPESGEPACHRARLQARRNPLRDLISDDVARDRVRLEARDGRAGEKRAKIATVSLDGTRCDLGPEVMQEFGDRVEARVRGPIQSTDSSLQTGQRLNKPLALVFFSTRKPCPHAPHFSPVGLSQDANLQSG